MHTIRVVMIAIAISCVLEAMEDTSCLSKLRQKKYSFAEDDTHESDEAFKKRIQSTSNLEAFSLRINKIQFLLSLSDNIKKNKRKCIIKRLQNKKPKTLWKTSYNTSEQLPVIDRFSLSPDHLNIIINGHYEKDKAITLYFINTYDRRQEKAILSDVAIQAYDEQQNARRIVTSAISSDGKRVAILQDRYLQNATTHVKEVKHELYLVDTESCLPTAPISCLHTLNVPLVSYYRGGLLVIGFNKQGTKVLVHTPKSVYAAKNEIYYVSDFEAKKEIAIDGCD